MPYAYPDVSRTLRHGAELSRILPGSKGTALFNGLLTVRQVLDGYRDAKSWYQEKTRWTITVRSDDRLYDSAHRWFAEGGVLSAPPRALSARYSRNGGRRGSDDLDDMLGRVGRRREGQSEVGVDMYWDDTRERTVLIDGHRVTVSLFKPESGPNAEGGYRVTDPDVLYFHARSREGQQAVADLLLELARKQEQRRPALYMLSSYGDWSRRDDLPQRPPESVVLAAGQMERLQADMGGFLRAEGDYVRRGIPYHRGYLLYGPPGTGKTSVVRALAAHFNMDLWYAALGDLGKDASLISLINQVGPRSILLLEDIDIFHAARDRDDKKDGLSMAGLLNALDGVATPHGLITVLTTNDVAVIDKALLRPGRVDLQEYIGLPDSDQIARLFQHWYGVPMRPEQVERLNFQGSTAHVSEILKRHMDDPDQAAIELLSTTAEFHEFDCGGEFGDKPHWHPKEPVRRLPRPAKSRELG